MLNLDRVTNKQLWKFCFASAIAFTILGIITVGVQVFDYWNEYQMVLSASQNSLNGGEPAILSQLPGIIRYGIFNVSQVAALFFFFVSVFFIASIIFKRLATTPDTQEMIEQDEQASADEDEASSIEIVDLPKSSRT